MTEQTQQKRQHKVKSKYGMVDYYSFYRKELGGSVNKRNYRSIINDINHEIANEFAKSGKDIMFPAGLGNFTIYKRKGTVSLVDDKLQVSKPIDYAATKKLWDSNPEYRDEKRYVRHENTHSNGYSYRIVFMRKYATVKNISHFKFNATRDIKRSLARNIRDGNIVAQLDKYREELKHGK